MKTAGLLGLAVMSMAAMASVPYEVRGDRVLNTPGEPRLRHGRKVHPRSDGYLCGSWPDPDWNEREAARRNAEMELERRAHKARKLEEGRARVAAGLPRLPRKFEKWVIHWNKAIVTAWG